MSVRSISVIASQNFSHQVEMVNSDWLCEGVLKSTLVKPLPKMSISMIKHLDLFNWREGIKETLEIKCHCVELQSEYVA